MSLRSISFWLLCPKLRILVAVLCTTVALTASGVPCLCVCLGHAAGAPKQPSSSPCHHTDSTHDRAGHGSGHGHCPPASTCMQDQTPAVSIQPASLEPSLEQSPLFPSAVLALNTTPSEASVRLKARASPDHSPPI